MNPDEVLPLVSKEAAANDITIKYDNCAQMIASLLLNYRDTLLKNEQLTPQQSDQFYLTLCRYCKCYNDEIFNKLKDEDQHLGVLNYVTYTYFNDTTSMPWVQGVKLEKAYDTALEQFPNAKGDSLLKQLEQYNKLVESLGTETCTAYYEAWKSKPALQFYRETKGGSTLKKRKMRKNNTKRKKTKQKRIKQAIKRTRRNRK
jgi:hypothetical protein